MARTMRPHRVPVMIPGRDMKRSGPPMDDIP
jgi:hypothetical protein